MKLLFDGIRERPRGRLVVFVCLLLATTVDRRLANGASQPRPYDWLQFNGDAQHSGNNTRERLISPATVLTLRRLFRVRLQGVEDGVPVVLTKVHTARGTRDLLFLTDTNGTIEARDARTGRRIWSQSQYGPATGAAPGQGTCFINKVAGNLCYTTSSPAIDPNHRFVYSYGLDGKVHKYVVGSGREITSGGWPEVASRKPWQEKGSPPLTTVTVRAGTTYLYAKNGGYPGDQGDYQGHLTTIDLATGKQHVFQDSCSNQPDRHFVDGGVPDCPYRQTAQWARAGVIYDAATDRIYAAVGRGTFDPRAHDWGDSVVALHPNGTGRRNGDPLDSYTPTNATQLDAADLDVGSTNPAILPALPGMSIYHLAVQAGKDGKLRLLNLDRLSGRPGIGHAGGDVGAAPGHDATMPVPQGGEVLTQPAVWKDPRTGRVWVFVANDNGTSALQLTVGNGSRPVLRLRWRVASSGTSPLLANGVLFEASDGNIKALDPRTGKVLWNDSIGGIHWQSPVVADGVLYIADQDGNLTAYKPRA